MTPSPTVTLALSDAAIAEDGGATTVTASLSHASSVATDGDGVRESGIPRRASDYTLSTNMRRCRGGDTAVRATVTIPA